MSSKYPILPPKDIIAVLKKYGFSFISQRGSHAKYADKKHVVIIPMHDEVRAGTLKSILDMAEIDVEDFKRML